MSRDAELPRALRRVPTAAETLLWRHLRGHQLGAHFRRQHPVGGYVADFACVPARLIVEIDGGQHADGADATRDAALRAAGWRVLRFWNDEVMSNLSAVLETIRVAVAEAPPPNPPPQAGEG